MVIRGRRGEAALARAAEFSSASDFAFLQQTSGAAPLLALSAERLAALGGAVADECVVLRPRDQLDLAVARALVDPLAGAAAAGILSRFELRPAGRCEAAAVKLAKLAGLLPAALVAPVPATAAGVARWAAARGLLVVPADQILAHEQHASAQLRPVSRARVPLADAEDAELIVFRSTAGSPEHLAIVVGQPDPREPVLARLHSECFTGDLLASLRCDCGEQLRGAVGAMAAAGGGVLLYLAQEGRGIGLANKLRAYALQDQGFDTIDANRLLGFAADERDYRPAAEILRQLGYPRVRLMTNNPDKLAALARHGIIVVERVPLAFPSNPHNRGYLQTKAVRSGHQLGAALEP